LVKTLAARYENIYRPITAVEPELVDFLRTQPFIGNIRELENAVVRMLFAKSHGTSLCVEDWCPHPSDANGEPERDLIGEAAHNLWQSISSSHLSYAQAFQQLEQKVLVTALLGGRTRREVAKKLQTSERTLYHMIRTHHLTKRTGT
jgi:DNA-binding NtrC family response regulator